ncbi:hypothetical protein [Micromonospora maritima]|uniref:Uncharacterized protein n=1 Tax=Micromonospora maritima TaxID=986711 RepID=A0ABW7ZGN5_9ACTN
MVRVPSDRALPDPLVGLGEPERSRVLRSETRLLDHLDRLARRGLWPPR